MPKLWRRFRDWLDPFEAEKRRLGAQHARSKALAFAAAYGVSLSYEEKQEVLEYLLTLPSWPYSGGIAIGMSAGVLQHQMRNGKRTPTPGTIPNARAWKDMTPRRRSGPFLRLRDREGNFIR